LTPLVVLPISITFGAFIGFIGYFFCGIREIAYFQIETSETEIKFSIPKHIVSTRWEDISKVIVEQYKTTSSNGYCIDVYCPSGSFIFLHESPISPKKSFYSSEIHQYDNTGLNLTGLFEEIRAKAINAEFIYKDGKQKFISKIIMLNLKKLDTNLLSKPLLLTDRKEFDSINKNLKNFTGR